MDLKLSKMDLESRSRWEEYSKARDDMFKQTNIPEAPWWVVEADSKRSARLNCISHLLSQIPYEQTKSEVVEMPERELIRTPEQPAVDPANYVPRLY